MPGSASPAFMILPHNLLTFPNLCGRIRTLQQPGPVAQLGARLNRTEEARGSNPLRSTGGLSPAKNFQKYTFHGPIAQLGARLNGIEKAEGSNPSGSTKTAKTGVVRHPSASRESKVRARHRVQRNTQTELACLPILGQAAPVKPCLVGAGYAR